jgi:hypothetical protein
VASLCYCGQLGSVLAIFRIVSMAKTKSLPNLIPLLCYFFNLEVFGINRPNFNLIEKIFIFYFIIIFFIFNIFKKKKKKKKGFFTFKFGWVFFVYFCYLVGTQFFAFGDGER